MKKYLQKMRSIKPKKLGFFLGQLDTLRAVYLYFKNPALIIFMRLGLIKVPYFYYRIKKGSDEYSMMARPTTTSLADLFVLKELFIHETYKDILKILPKQGIRFIDIGGNIGAFTVWLASKAKIAEGFIFEPLEENLRILNFNLRANQIKKIKIIPSAVGGSSRKVAMELNLKSPGGSSIYTQPSTENKTAKKIQVKALRHWLDEITGNFHLLKLDCEGAEWEILNKTPHKYFTRFNLVVAEVHATNGKSNVSEFVKYFEKAGFETKRWDNQSHGLYIGVRKN